MAERMRVTSLMGGTPGRENPCESSSNRVLPCVAESRGFPQFNPGEPTGHFCNDGKCRRVYQPRGRKSSTELAQRSPSIHQRPASRATAACTLSLIRDRDGINGREVRRSIRSMGIEEIVVATRSPWQSPYVESLI